MISFTRKDKTVIVQVEANTGVAARFFQFSVVLSDNVYASLLRQNFADYFAQKIRIAREESYLQGWSDAKSKRAKADWFRGSL